MLAHSSSIPHLPHAHKATFANQCLCRIHTGGWFHPLYCTGHSTPLSCNECVESRAYRLYRPMVESKNLNQLISCIGLVPSFSTPAIKTYSHSFHTLDCCYVGKDKNGSGRNQSASIRCLHSSWPKESFCKSS